MSTQTIPPSSKTRQLLNKVPQVTIYFWIIKCLCTTIGETMSDNLMGRFAVGSVNATPGQLQVAQPRATQTASADAPNRARRAIRTGGRPEALSA
jgi:hypothetical protein